MCRGPDPEGQGHHRRIVRRRLLGLLDLGDQQAPGREPQGLRRAPTRRTFSWTSILDARDQKVREGGVVASQAVLIAIGVDWDGCARSSAVDMAIRESCSSWKDFLLGLRQPGLHGVYFVVADDHAGLRSAIREVSAEAAFQRCYVHPPPTPSTICRARPTMHRLQQAAPRWYDRRSAEEARRDLSAWIAEMGEQP